MMNRLPPMEATRAPWAAPPESAENEEEEEEEELADELGDLGAK